MPIHTLPSVCWTTTSMLDDEPGHAHWDSEAQALNVVIRQFVEDTTRPGELPGRYTAACLIVRCDGPDCGEPLCDLEWEFPIHFDTYREVLDHLAEDARSEARSRRSDFPYRAWGLFPDGRTLCPDCRDLDGIEVPAVPLTAQEQAEAGQQVLL